MMNVPTISKSSLIISETSKIGINRIKSDYIQVWSFLNQPHFAKGSKEAYERVIRKFFEFHSQCGILEIKTPHVSLFLKTLEGKSAATKNLYRAALESLFDFLTKSGYTERNPVSPIKSVKITPMIEDKILPPDSIARMIELETKPRNRIMLLLLYFATLRESELINLKFSNFHERAGGGAKIFVRGKGNKERFVLIPSTVMSEVEAYAKEHNLATDDYIFFSPGDRRKPITRVIVNRAVAAAADRAGIIPRPTPHWFRHSGSEHAQQNGANLREIQLSLGHSSLATTAIYFSKRSKKGTGDYLQLPNSAFGATAKSNKKL